MKLQSEEEINIKYDELNLKQKQRNIEQENKQKEDNYKKPLKHIVSVKLKEILKWN